MNKLIYFNTILAIIALVLIGIFYINRNDRVGFVDIVKVLNNSKQFKKINADFKNDELNLKSKYEKIFKELKGDLAKIEKESSNKTDNDLRINFQNKQNQYSKYLDSEKDKLKKNQINQTQELINLINFHSREYAIKYNYSLILGANGSGNIIYGSVNNDLTNEIIKALE